MSTWSRGVGRTCLFLHRWAQRRMNQCSMVRERMNRCSTVHGRENQCSMMQERILYESSPKIPLGEAEPGTYMSQVS